MRDGWTEAPLAAVATRVTEKNRNLLDKVFTVSAEYGLIDQETFFNKRVASKNLLGYTVVQPGMLVYNKSYSVTAPYGVITRNHHEHPGVVSPLYLVFSPQEDKVLGTYLVFAFGETFRTINKQHVPLTASIFRCSKEQQACRDSGSVEKVRR